MERKATATWKWDRTQSWHLVVDGRPTDHAPMLTWQQSSEDPYHLLAVMEAGVVARAVMNEISRYDMNPNRVVVHVETDIDLGDGHWEITKIRVAVAVHAQNQGWKCFDEIIEQARNKCPVLVGVPVRLEARLEVAARPRY